MHRTVPPSSENTPRSVSCLYSTTTGAPFASSPSESIRLAGTGPVPYSDARNDPQQRLHVCLDKALHVRCGRGKPERDLAHAPAHGAAGTFPASCASERTQPPMQASAARETGSGSVQQKAALPTGLSNRFEGRLSATYGALAEERGVRQSCVKGASGVRQDIARNARKAHNAHSANLQLSGPFRRFKDRDALNMVSHRKDAAFHRRGSKVSPAASTWDERQPRYGRLFQPLRCLHPGKGCVPYT